MITNAVKNERIMEGFRKSLKDFTGMLTRKADERAAITGPTNDRIQAACAAIKRRLA